MSDDIAIRVRGLGKKYAIGGAQEKYLTIRDAIVHFVKTPYNRIFPRNSDQSTNEFWALKDINFDVYKGEVVGIIGRNGAGKSTLLKILSRITAPTEGTVELHGRVGSLLEVGTGFHPEMTGRENIYLNGSILGMKRIEIEDKFNEIVRFAEIDKFIDTPVKRYSSGMYVRLAFAVAAHLEPEILVVDEVLAVGDAGFQKKCLGKMGDVAKEGRTVLFVSHNMAAVETLCNCAIILNQGLIRFKGTQTAAISEYQRSFSANQALIRERTDRKGSGEVRIVGIEFRDMDGHTIDSVASGQDFDIVFHFESLSGFRSSQVIASFIVKTPWDVPVFLHHNRMTGDDFGVLPNQGAFVCRIRKIPLTPSTYRIGYSIMIGSDYLDGMSDAAELQIIAGKFFESGEVPPASHGFCLVEGRWSILT